ncbi:MAG: hypothetical protein HZB50_14190 [Chloroflexi bacterium]|nr:hypothetical protein [Chloroflexota bacterium]
MMELKSFVKETIVQIIEGVKEAQDHALDFGAIVNPKGFFTEHEIIKWLPERLEKGGWREGQVIDFDVSIAISETDEARGGLGIQVASTVIGLGVSGKSEEQNSTISRLKFSVPLFLPESSGEK